PLTQLRPGQAGPDLLVGQPLELGQQLPGLAGERHRQVLGRVEPPPGPGVGERANPGREVLDVRHGPYRSRWSGALVQITEWASTSVVSTRCRPDPRPRCRLPSRPRCPPCTTSSPWSDRAPRTAAPPPAPGRPAPVAAARRRSRARSPRTPRAA